MTHLLVKLGELAADRSLARPEAVREVGERGGKARPGLEQYEGRGNTLELGDARALPLLRRQDPANRKRSVGRPLTVSAASTADAPGTALTGVPCVRAARTSL